MAPDSTPASRWAVIGPGGIANRFAGALPAVPGARLSAVFARDASKGQAYANQWQREGEAPARVTTVLAEVLGSDEVDAVYIATPHSHHGEYVRAALEAGKPVLCEKPLVTTHAEGQALVTLARSRGVFLMEALWTRFLPAYDVAARLLQDGAIGELRAMQSSFCFSSVYNPEHRQWNPALAVVNATLVFPGGVTSQFRCGFDASSVNSFEALGSKAALRFPTDFWQAEAMELVTRKAPPERVAAPFVINGFEGEIAEAQACIRAGWVESPRMPHAETLALLAWMDAIRARFPKV